MQELAIIGSGPAGMTAAIYAVRRQMDFVLLTKEIGGRMGLAADIHNYPGYHHTTGRELTDKFQRQIIELQIEPKFEEVVKIEKANNGFKIKTDKGEHEAKTVIVASGARHGKLNIPGEKEYANRGVSYCATCDAPLFFNKDVAVVGSGNPGLNAVLMLTRIANKIYLIERGPLLRGDEVMRDNIQGSEKVTVLTNTRVKEILGEKFATGMKVERNGNEETLNVQGIFIETAYAPNSEFVAKFVELNERHEIIVDANCRTNIAGIFAAGDVTNSRQKQIVVAAGGGAIAVLSAYEYLHKIKSD